MEVTFVFPPPYLASTRWIREKGNSFNIKSRDYTRTLIESNSAGGIVLTVPVAGGSSAVKRLTPEKLNISGHGDWTRIHLGAIEAAYGREPYFQHLFSDIASVIENYPEHLSLLNVMLMTRMLEFVDYRDSITEIEKFRKSHPRRCIEITARLQSYINLDHSFLEPLFRLGPDAIFLL